MEKKKGWDGLKDYASKGGKSTSEMGRFIRTAQVTKNIPEEAQALFNWYKGKTKKEIDYLKELTNIYEVLKGGILESMLKKMDQGILISRQELDQFRLITDILQKSHKLKYGDKKVVEHVVTIADIRRQMEDSTGKKILSAKVIKDAD